LIAVLLDLVFGLRFTNHRDVIAIVIVFHVLDFSQKLFKQLKVI